MIIGIVTLLIGYFLIDWANRRSQGFRSNMPGLLQNPLTEVLLIIVSWGIMTLGLFLIGRNNIWIAIAIVTGYVGLWTWNALGTRPRSQARRVFKHYRMLMQKSALDMHSGKWPFQTEEEVLATVMTQFLLLNRWDKYEAALVVDGYFPSNGQSDIDDVKKLMRILFSLQDQRQGLIMDLDRNKLQDDAIDWAYQKELAGIKTRSEIAAEYFASKSQKSGETD